MNILNKRKTEYKKKNYSTVSVFWHPRKCKILCHASIDKRQAKIKKKIKNCSLIINFCHK